MKPLDLERFEGATKGPWVPFIKGRTIAVMTEDNKQVISWTGFDGSDLSLNEQAKNAKLIASAPDLINEIKALREWRLAITAAHDRFYTETDNYTAAGQGFILPYKHFVESWNAAEAKLKLEGGV